MRGKLYRAGIPCVEFDYYPQDAQNAVDMLRSQLDRPKIRNIFPYGA